MEDDGVDRQALLFGAREDAESATEAVLVLAAKKSSAMSAIVRMETEHRLAGEDTRPTADKRKRQEAKGSDEKKKDGEGRDEEPTA